MKIILFGAPGAGKGTQSKLLVDRFGWSHVSTGDMLREAVTNKTEVGLKIEKMLGLGQLVSDDLIIDILKEKLSKFDPNQGLILDGFPRTVNQAEMLIKEHLEVNHVVYLKVNEKEVCQRLSGRRVHLPSGRVYHVDYNPPLKAGFDDVTGEPLIHRKDDYPEQIKLRFDLFYQETMPVLDVLSKEYVVHTLNISNEDVQSVFKKVLNALDL